MAINVVHSDSASGEEFVNIYSEDESGGESVQLLQASLSSARGHGDEDGETCSCSWVGQCRRNWRRVAAIVSLWTAYLLCNAAYSTINPFFPQVAESKGIPPVFIGIIISSAPCSAMFLSPVLGYLLPRIGVGLMIFMGLLLVGSSYLLLGATTIIPVDWAFIVTCVILRLIEGVGTAFVATSTFSTLPHFFPKSVGTLMGLFEVGSGFGYSLGTSLGGILYQYGGYRVPFLTIGGAILLFVIPCTFMVRREKITYEKRSISFKHIRSLSSDILIVSLVMVVCISFNSTSYLAPSLPVFLKNEFDQSPVLIGALYSTTILYLFSALFTGPVADKLGLNRQFIVCGLLFNGVGFLLIGVPYCLGYRSMVMIWIAFGVGAVSAAMNIVPIYPELLKLGGRYMRPGDSKDALSSFISGILASATSFSNFFAPLLGGLLASFLPVPMCAVVIAEAMFSLAMLLIGLIFIKKMTHQHNNSYS